MTDRLYMVTGLSGQAGGLCIHRFKVRARNKDGAKRRISRSSGYSKAWDGERIRRLDAIAWEEWMAGPSVKDLT